MSTLIHIALFVSIAIFVGIMFRARRHLQLPKTLLSSGILLLIGQLWNLAQSVLGIERLQAILLSVFPVVNDPSYFSETSYMVESTNVGLVYWRIIVVSGFFSATGLLLAGLGLLFHTKRLTMEQLFRNHPTMPS